MTALDMTPLARLSLLLLAALAPGCAQDPYDRPGTWSLPPQGLGANDANLRAMIADPSDLAAGRDDGAVSLGAEAGRPVARLLAGKRAALPGGGASSIGASGASGGSQPGGGGGSSGGSGSGSGTPDGLGGGSGSNPQ